MRYSLARYILTVALPEDFDTTFVAAFGSTLSIGGEGSYLNSISISLAGTLWSTEGDATGSWVHNQNLDRTGECKVSISQVSDNIFRFIRLCNCFYSSSITYERGINLTLKDNEGNTVATCEDCYISKIPDQDFGEKAATQDWSFTCGKITFNAVV